MVISPFNKKINTLFATVALSVCCIPAQAAHSYLPTGWTAKPPLHLRSRTATLLPSGMSPGQIKKAYNIPDTYQGAGQVIAIVDSYDDPSAEADLNVFSSTFGLPACTTENGCFKKVYSGGTKPKGDTGWATEISLDIQWAHAIAPQAKILLVEAPDASDNLFNAVTYAIQQGATVISLSWGAYEWPGELSFDSIFKNSPVPIFVSSGDSGNGISYPAASPYVVSVGGTELKIDSDGNYIEETAWNGSGGGISKFEKEPEYQSNYAIPKDKNKGRGIPDVAYNASPNSGVSIYDSYGQGGWLVVGGTSASAPQWAALAADIASAKGSNFQDINTSLYDAASSSASTLFNNITMGQNGSCGYYCKAHSGYDYITGLGTPKAANLVDYFSKTDVPSNR